MQYTFLSTWSSNKTYIPKHISSCQICWIIAICVKCVKGVYILLCDVIFWNSLVKNLCSLIYFHAIHIFKHIIINIYIKTISGDNKTYFILLDLLSNSKMCEVSLYTFVWWYFETIYSKIYAVWYTFMKYILLNTKSSNKYIYRNHKWWPQSIFHPARFFE